MSGKLERLGVFKCNGRIIFQPPWENQRNLRGKQEILSILGWCHEGVVDASGVVGGWEDLGHRLIDQRLLCCPNFWLLFPLSRAWKIARWMKSPSPSTHKFWMEIFKLSPSLKKLVEEIMPTRGGGWTPTFSFGNSIENLKNLQRFFVWDEQSTPSSHKHWFLVCQHFIFWKNKFGLPK